jgi:hypothetical protein
VGFADKQYRHSRNVARHERLHNTFGFSKDHNDVILSALLEGREDVILHEQHVGASKCAHALLRLLAVTDVGLRVARNFRWCVSSEQGCLASDLITMRRFVRVGWLVRGRVALPTQHAKSMRDITLSSVASLAPPYFSTLSHRRYYSRENVTKHKMCILISF